MPRPWPRQYYLQILSAALITQQYRFARQAALDWLATYPGDLQVGLHYSKALLGEGRIAQAIRVLQGLRRADPEFVEAVEALVQADAQTEGSVNFSALTHFVALTGRNNGRQMPASWGERLWLARHSLELGQLERAGELIEQSLREAENAPIAGLLHLRYLAASRLMGARDRREIALNYHQRWPDCVACMLWLAQWSLEIGEADYAVALLHQAVSRDVGGQVVQRLWGEKHPYRVLWPENLELQFTLPIPAEVIAYLGWNRLPPGEKPLIEPIPEPIDASEPQPNGAGGDEGDLLSELEPLPGESRALQPAFELDWALAEFDMADLKPVQESASPLESVGYPKPSADERAIFSAIPPKVGETVPISATTPAASVPAGGGSNGSKPPKAQDPELNAVGQELDRLARKLKLPLVGRQDGRYPVYVVFSVRSRLERAYGAQMADLLVSEMLALVEAVGRRKGWNARLFMPDDPGLLSPLGMSPLHEVDPWGLKLALADLDAALARRGERIGAVLIVGGPEIVPFHHLPNPVDDQDDDVPTDSPYATRDENYFIPEWPVGRLPAGKGDDARLMLESLRRIREFHEAQQRRLSWLQSLARWFARLYPLAARSGSKPISEGEARVYPKPFLLRPGGRVKAFGYTAAIWKRAARLVFRPIGKPSALSASPPFGVDGATLDDSGTDGAGIAGKIPALRGRLAYFNLHGLVDAAEWYGQRDPLTSGAEPDYPVALRPKDILLRRKDAQDEMPQVVFSEACYGLHIQDREVDEAVCLSFLKAGSLAVVGSTCMAYGSIAEPLVAADLLGHTFWRYLQQGFAAGEALRHAKIHLASVMSQRQGYLDGEDQKTLISFNLYGDPLAQPIASERTPKSLRFQSSPLASVQTVCERVGTNDLAAAPSDEVMTHVKRVVARYLPGMSDARATLVHPRAGCPGEGHTCPTSQLGPRDGLTKPNAEANAKGKASRHSRQRNRRYPSKGAGEDPYSLVILSKQEALSNGLHPRVARLTLDERGRLVKLVVSR
jgi:tetratricopeptide (TPR) repeat protein